MIITVSIVTIVTKVREKKKRHTKHTESIISSLLTIYIRENNHRNEKIGCNTNDRTNRVPYDLGAKFELQQCFFPISRTPTLYITSSHVNGFSKKHAV